MVFLQWIRQTNGYNQNMCSNLVCHQSLKLCRSPREAECWSLLLLIKQQSVTLIVNPKKSCYFKGNCILYVLDFKERNKSYSYSIHKSGLD